MGSHEARDEPLESHAGACHGKWRRLPSIGSRVTSAKVGTTREAAGKAPQRAHSDSSDGNTGAGGMVHSTLAWRRPCVRSYSSAAT